MTDGMTQQHHDDDMWMLHRAYMAAHDEDVWNAQNAMSDMMNHSPMDGSSDGSSSGIDGTAAAAAVVVYPTTTPSSSTSSTATTTTQPLLYYTVPYHWFHSFYQQVFWMDKNHSTTSMTTNWKDAIGPIPYHWHRNTTTTSSTTTTTTPTTTSTSQPPIYLNELHKKLRPPLPHHHHHSRDSDVEDPSQEERPIPSSIEPSTIQIRSLHPPSPPQHGHDYILVGSNVWLLLSSKFGRDHHPSHSPPSLTPPRSNPPPLPTESFGVACMCVRTTTTTASVRTDTHPPPADGVVPPSSRIVVQVPILPYVPYPPVSITSTTNPNETTTTTTTSTTTFNNHMNPIPYDDIPIPLSGRFPYEQYFQSSLEVIPPPQPPLDHHHRQDDDIHNHTVSSSYPSIVVPPSTTTTTTTTTGMNPQDMEAEQESPVVSNGPLKHVDDHQRHRNHCYNRIDQNHNNNNNRSISTLRNDEDEEDHDDLFRSNTSSPIPGSQPFHPRIISSSHNTNYNNNNDNNSNSSTVTVPVRRKYGSGLGNLGNTCFMNSTLQCLGHTLVLQYYFLSQQYQTDLNRYNPLGTGGELATQFAQLLSEMWTTTMSTRHSHYDTTHPSHCQNNNNDTTTTTSNNYNNNNKNIEVRYTTASNIVYPKNFKYTLGKHAAQFMGYDQHDSQELATYLLDALHEDCNRITTKPYIEKPEQAMEETDQQASDKAWELHLQREDSHILEYFMGQVKSRVQCNQIECQRISTTFDPFMFLSVPIPGSEDRTIQLTFVPIDTHLQNVKLSIKMNKLSTIDDMIRKLIEMLPELYEKDQYESSSLCTPSLSSSDLMVCDVWKNEVFDFIQNKEDIEKIRDNDETFVYQLTSLQMIRQQEAQFNDETYETTTKTDTEVTTKYNFKEWKRSNQASNGTTTMTTTNGSSTSSKYRLHNLDVGTLTQLNRDQEWFRILQNKYMKAPLILVNAFHFKKGSTEEKVRIYRRLAFFLDHLHQSICVGDASNENHRYEYGEPKRVRGSLDCTASSGNHTNDPTQKIQELIDCSEAHTVFQNVQTMEDLAILEFIAKKMYLEILQGERAMKTKQLQAFPNGVIVEVRIRTNTEYHNYISTIPLVMRLSSNTTVYQFREIIAQRLVRCIKIGTSANQGNAHDNSNNPVANIRNDATSDDYWSTAPSTSKFAVAQAWDNATNPAIPENGDQDPADMDLGVNPDPTISTSSDPLYDEALKIVCCIPLLYDRKNSTAPHNRSSATSRSFGSVNTGQTQQRSHHLHSPTNSDYHRPVITYARHNHNEEKELISEIVGNYGHVYISIPSSYIQDESFDLDAMHAVDVYQPSPSSATSRNSSGDITVLDCIEKFCQKEQLEESEQWYCNQCQQHVCAWKQFHIYRCPPHLIVHLKRFQFSARTHRRQKINIHVDFPLTGLDLSKQVLHWNNDNEKPIYDCYAVSNHYGGLGGGHYTAYAINDDGVWCHYDDSRITSHVSPSEVVSSAAYVLYYRRRDVPVDMEYIQKIVSSPQPIITQHQPYISPYSTVVGRDDNDDDVENIDDNRPLLHKHNTPRVVSDDTAVVPLFAEEEDDESNENKNSTNFEESATTMNMDNTFPARDRIDDDDDDTGSHSSDDGLPLPSGLRALSASTATTGAMIVVVDDDDDNDNHASGDSNHFNSNDDDDDDGTDDFYDTVTTTTDRVAMENDDPDIDVIVADIDDDDDSPTTTTSESSTRVSSFLPLQ